MKRIFLLLVVYCFYVFSVTDNNAIKLNKRDRRTSNSSLTAKKSLTKNNIEVTTSKISNNKPNLIKSRQIKVKVNSPLKIETSQIEKGQNLEPVNKFIEKEFPLRQGYDGQAKANHVLIRVLIQESNLKDKPKLVINSNDGFVISDLENKKSYNFKENLLDIFYDQNNFNLNGRKLKSKEIMILPKKDHITFNNNSYHGGFAITIRQNKLYLVNFVDLEDYVLSVLPSESWPGWPKEVNKALCICFRSYALAKVLEQRKLNKKRKIKSLFDVKNTNIHQTYNGFKNCSQLKEAVEETKGVILAYNNQPIIAMFDSCCGGVVPADIKDINFSKSPYLARSYPCTYCKSCFIHSWEKEYSVKDLEKILSSSYKNIKIRNIQITDIDKAGKVHEVRFKGPTSWIKVTGKKLYSLLKDVKSFCYKIEKRSEKIIFKGRGYGHHLGLCQWGAYNMIKSNWSYKDTLKFFYPNTVFMKLQTKTVSSNA